MDRFGRKTAYLGLFAGFLLGTLACGLARQYHTLLAARALTGAFGGILGGLGLTIVADVFPEEQRGRATGRVDVGLCPGRGRSACRWACTWGRVTAGTFRS